MILLIADELFFGSLDFKPEIVDLRVQPVGGLRGRFVPRFEILLGEGPDQSVNDLGCEARIWIRIRDLH